MVVSHSILKKIDSPVGSVSLWENGILHTHTKAEMEINVAICEEIHQIALEITNGKPYPNLFTFTKYVLPDEDSRNFMLLPKRLALTCADAIVVNSLAQKIIGNFYLKINRPPIPTKLFSKQEDAEKWLLQYVKSH